jgi:hypothetical protein
VFAILFGPVLRTILFYDGIRVLGLWVNVKQICTISETGRLYKVVCFVID